MKSILIMGAPGTGKGTFAQLLKKDLPICHIATGDIFRENIKFKTPVGIEALKYIEKGILVPDEITDEMLRLRLQKEDVKNFITLLDGYPRNLHQASKTIELLAEIKRQIDLIIWLNTPESIIIDRICNRRLCKDCGQVYNIKNFPSKVEGKCDKCNGELYQRQDDNEEFVANRLQEYEKATLPLIDFYKNKVSILEIDTSIGSLEENYEKIVNAINS